MRTMFIRLMFIKTVVEKIVDNQGIDSPETLSSLSDDDIASICDAIKRSSDLVTGEMSDRAN